MGKYNILLGLRKIDSFFEKIGTWQLFYLIIRLCIVTIIVQFKDHWFIELICWWYILYPICSYYFSKIYWICVEHPEMQKMIKKETKH